ncbi:hypothetical protein VPH35_113080 [Triticum aestivum]
MMNLYKGGLKLPNIPALNELRKSFPIQLIKELLPVGGDYMLKLPKPDIIKENESAWRTDEEFAREILAGVNPVSITRLTEFPPKSSLDPSKYSDQTSTITAHHIEKSLEGLSVQQALDGKKLYILDHHDHFMPFLLDINSLDGVHAYATRTLLFLRGDDTLKPLAIELLAPARQPLLSVVHPLFKLLQPHYRDTMTINALARQTLINAGGIFEQTVFMGKHSLAISSVVYKDWNFTDQALPDDLIKSSATSPLEEPTVTRTANCVPTLSGENTNPRNEAWPWRTRRSPARCGCCSRTTPYPTDGLAIWQAIEEWVTDYCAIYYKDEKAVKGDEELQAWWKEVREVGHSDLKDAAWWPAMQTVAELTKACATIVWIASALHAAVNFGQYSYAGYVPNRPTVSRRAMPDPGSEEYAELEREPERFFIRTITSQLQTLLGISLLEILSKHSSDEIYLGQRDTPTWTSDAEAVGAFGRLGENLVRIESEVVGRNSDPLLKNRIGRPTSPTRCCTPTRRTTRARPPGSPPRASPTASPYDNTL